jgi:hypothetical protein
MKIPYYPRFTLSALISSDYSYGGVQSSSIISISESKKTHEDEVPLAYVRCKGFGSIWRWLGGGSA